MLQFLLGGVAVLGLSGVAAAADISARMPVKAPPLAAAYNWSGFYLGANAGYGVNRNESANVFGGAGDSFTSQPAGGFGGVQAGWNWQIRKIVFGIETDIQGAALRDSQTCLFGCSAISSLTVEQKLNWFGTTRGRIGLADGPIFPYLTGGVAYGEVASTVNLTTGGSTGGVSTSSTRTGWVYGAGVEAALDGNWTAKAEYLYVDLGSVSHGFSVGGTPDTFNTRWESHLFRAGVNYRFGDGGSTAIAPVTDWRGLYAGVNFGAGRARDPSNLNVGAPLVPGTQSFNLVPFGFVGGGQVGYNWQSGRIVFGVETDLQGSLQKDDRTCVLGCTATSAAMVEQKLPWIGTTRARLGYAVGPALFYVTGGVAYGGVKTNIVERAVGTADAAFGFSNTRVGWTAGAGIERNFELFGLVGPNWTVRTEYLYVDLGSLTNSYNYAGAPHSFNTTVREHIWRSAISYKFSGPVTANY